MNKEQKAQWINENLKDGELYAGIILGKDGEPDHHLILLPGRDNKKMTWQDAMAAAKKAGEDLPTRREQSLLFANLKDQFKEAWYWSNEQHAVDSDYAWVQGFINGFQNYGLKSYEGRARAVRRLIIL